jgi:CheY-like chemotaxis protein
MPGIDGRETLRRMRAMGFDTPVILTSGYPADSALPDVKDDFVHFLPKPFSQGTLKQMLREIFPDRALCGIG